MAKIGGQMSPDATACATVRQRREPTRSLWSAGRDRRALRTGRRGPESRQYRPTAMRARAISVSSGRWRCTGPVKASRNRRNGRDFAVTSSSTMALC
jgi:hypothetical protein